MGFRGSLVPPQLVPLPPVVAPYVDAVISDPYVLRDILNRAIISVSTLALTLVLATPAAYALARRRPPLITSEDGITT